MFQEQQRVMDNQHYQQNQMDGDQYNSDLQNPQIFYKKDQEKVVYEEGQETYRGPEGFTQQLTHEIKSQDSNGQALRKRGVSPQTREVIQSQQRQRQQMQ